VNVQIANPNPEHAHFTNYDLFVKGARVAGVLVLSSAVGYATGLCSNSITTFINTKVLGVYSNLDQLVTKVCVAVTSTVGLGIGCVFASLEYSAYKREVHLVELIKNRAPTQNVVLMCQATADFFGVVTCVSQDCAHVLKQLLETTSVVWVKSTSVQDINTEIQKLKDQGRSVSTLWLNTHGNELSVKLSRNPNGTLYGHDCFTLDFSGLTADADIVIDACETAKPQESTLNFAEYFQLAAGPARQVYAAVRKCSTLRYNSSHTGNKPRWQLLSDDVDVTAKISYEALRTKVLQLC
jgi:hypothetical protein